MSQWLSRILENKTREGDWSPGSLVQLAPDTTVVHDLAFPSAARAFAAMGEGEVRSPDHIYVFHDHMQPAKDVSSADLGRKGNVFASEQGINNVFSPGHGGILTVALDEVCRLKPGMLIAGTDTHMPTYGAFGIVALNIGPTDLGYLMHHGSFWFEVPPTIRVKLTGNRKPYVEGKDIGLWLLGKIGLDGGLGSFFFLDGELVDSLGTCSRRHLCNHMVEAGAVGTIMKPNPDTLQHLRLSSYQEDLFEQIECDREMDFAVDDVTPQVAMPGRPDIVKPVEDLDEIDVDAVFIGSCAGGSLDDLQALDRVLEGHDIKPGVRVIVIPQSAGTFREAESLGIIWRIVSKGAYVSGPGCGPCMGAHLGVLGAGEVCVSTSPRNFPGRMGSRKAEIYLSNAWVAATACVTGKISHPREVLG